MLEDGRAYAVSNAGCDLSLEVIAAEVSDHALADWLLDQRSSVRGPGMTNVDLRVFSDRQRQDFKRAVTAALRAALARYDNSHLGLEQAQEPLARWMGGWLARFHDLEEMIERVDRGEPPEDFNPHMNGLVPPVRPGTTNRPPA